MNDTKAMDREIKAALLEKVASLSPESLAKLPDYFVRLVGQMSEAKLVLNKVYTEEQTAQAAYQKAVLCRQNQEVVLHVLSDLVASEYVAVKGSGTAPRAASEALEGPSTPSIEPAPAPAPAAPVNPV